MIEVSIINNQTFLNIDEKLEKTLIDLVELSLNLENINCEGEVSIMFVNDEEIHELNKIHRNMDKSTDVLSFPQYESLKDEKNLDPYVILGDVVISTETAKRQSKEYNHSLLREISFLLVHSIFHLLGHDHNNEKNTAKMRSLEEEVLSSYKITR